MKRFLKYLILLFLLLLTGIALWLFLKQPEPVTHRLIDALNEPIAGKEISVNSTDVLRSVFYKAEVDAVPRYYLKNFPADFPQNGDPVLFAKVLTPLILRANERVLQERTILKILDYKQKNNVAWTQKETDFFNQMVEKYDCVLFKTPETKLKELLIKVDEVPVSLAVIQAGLQTDFGRQKLTAPFGEKMWFDRTTYDDKPFKTLIEAVDSYILSLNATIPYYKWRMARQLIKPYKYRSRGNSFGRLLDAYAPDDPLYAEKIMTFYRKMRLATLDSARFTDN